MVVHWNNATSDSFELPGSTAQGSTYGCLEFIAISNDNTQFAQDDEAYKFMDDCTLLTVVNLVGAGLATYNVRNHVPSHIPVHNQFINSDNLQAQEYLNQVDKWTDSKTMKLNTRKTKCMIFDPTVKKQFTTNLTLKGDPVEIVDQYKSLGIILSNDLKWNLNTAKIVQKANMRMKILHTAAKFTSNISDLKIIYNQYIRSVLEYGSNVWHSGLTQQNRNDIERLQRGAVKIILKNNYESYKSALKFLNMDSLDHRREKMNLSFAKKCLKVDQMKSLFPQKNTRKTRHKYKFMVNKSKSERYKKSSVPTMQNLLNSDIMSKHVSCKQRTVHTFVPNL